MTGDSGNLDNNEKDDNDEINLKRIKAKNSESIFSSFSTIDRRILKALFGYNEINDFSRSRPTKLPSAATPEVYGLLWPKKNDSGDLLDISSEDNIPFDLKNFIEQRLKQTNDHIQPILRHDEKSIKQMFQDGINFDSFQEQAFMRSMEEFPRDFETNFSLKYAGKFPRGCIYGPVSRRQTNCLIE